MKKRFLRFFLGILYMGLMAGLLILYVENITGVIERMFAILGTLTLSAPAVIILVLYIRLKNREEVSHKTPSDKTEKENRLPVNNDIPLPEPEITHEKMEPLKSVRWRI